jgi:regulator of protease activity HflC (stomatin/prohibitin superfamily)
MDIAGVLKGFATIVWLATAGLLSLVVIRASRGKPLRRGGLMIAALVGFAVILTVVSAGLVFVKPEERGVVISPYDPQGYRAATLGSGLHWIIPGESVVRYPISSQTYTMSVASAEGQIQGDDSIRARTKDGQEVNVDASVIYAIDPNQVVELHIQWQDRYQDNVIRPLARGIIRDTASQYGIEEIVSSKRVEMEQKITDELTSKLSENNLILVDFILRDINFTEAYAAAVEQKQIAEQNALQAEFMVQQKKQEAEQARQEAQGVADSVVIKAKGDAEARIIQAKAEAEALNLIAAALQDNPDLLTYQYINKIGPNVRVIFIPSGTPLIFPWSEATAIPQ